MSEKESKGLVLVVDDDRSILNILHKSLTNAGYNVVTAENGRTALDLTARRNFDLVFLDIAMPGISGLDILTLMKAGRPDMPVIMLTGLKREDFEEESISRSAFAFMPKPFNVRDITGMAEQLIAGETFKEENVTELTN